LVQNYTKIKEINTFHKSKCKLQNYKSKFKKTIVLTEDDKIEKIRRTNI